MGPETRRHVARQRHKDSPPSASWTHLGLPLEVEGEDVLSPPCLALSDQEDAVARRASGQNQLGRLKTRQGAVEPLALAERVLHGLGGHRVREQERPCRGSTSDPVTQGPGCFQNQTCPGHRYPSLLASQQKACPGQPRLPRNSCPPARPVALEVEVLEEADP